MENPWLAISDETESCDEDQETSFLGVFTRSPQEIASYVKRPETPFINMYSTFVAPRPEMSQPANPWSLRKNFENKKYVSVY